VDVLISVAPQVRIGLRELYDMEQELEGLFGRKVDLVFRKAVEEGRNWIRRNHILKNNERIV